MRVRHRLEYRLTGARRGLKISLALVLRSGAVDFLLRGPLVLREGDRGHGDQPSWHETTVDRVQAALGEEAYAAATARGRGLSVEEAVELCGELST
jgi:hypothetical protein